ncbi:GNAT family N-acetyltransferase [Brachybacterium sp. GCM10030267]|uniref:GNAT family N-acetyltransferase n=1 Tax=Brachybacterium sp. GCM10030267 TaxID=3273381 RepID=UPI00361EF00E
MTADLPREDPSDQPEPTGRPDQRDQLDQPEQGDTFHWALRPAGLHDVEEIAFAELELFPDEAWTVFQLAAEIEHRDRRYVIAARGPDATGDLLGYAGIMLAGDVADLHTIGTRIEGVGIGRALLAWCEDQARRAGATRMLLEVREGNSRARTFYTTAGYRTIDRRRGYYRIRGRQIDALVMERDL